MSTLKSILRAFRDESFRNGSAAPNSRRWSRSRFAATVSRRVARYRCFFDPSLLPSSVASFAGASVLVLGTPLVFWGCQRSPDGVLQETVVVSSYPPTKAFAASSLGTIRPPAATTAPWPASPGLFGAPDATSGNATAANDAIATEKACSVVGFVNARKVSEDHYDLNRSAVAAIADALRQRPNTAASKQLVPARSERGVPGLRVEGVGERADCGLQSGDILVSVNGISVADEAELARNRQKLISSEEIKLVIERDRNAKVLTYDVGD